MSRMARVVFIAEKNYKFACLGCGGNCSEFYSIFLLNLLLTKLRKSDEFVKDIVNNRSDCFHGT